LLGNWGDLHRPSAVKSVAIVDRVGIGLPVRIKPPEIGRCIPSCASWLAVRSSRTVSIKLRQQWSLEQIAGWLKRTYPGELQNQVSPRDDLSQPVHSGAWGAEKRTA
jgi:hypothetical protein